MTIEQQYIADQGVLLIQVSGRFGIDSQKAFRNAYAEYDTSPSQVHVDLSNVSYIDSSGLGILLRLQEHYHKDMVIKLLNCSDEVKQVFELTHLDRFFDLE